YGEGLRLPPLRLVSRGTLNVDLEKVILANVRTPDERKGDLGAQLAATLRASERLTELARRYGNDVIIAALAAAMAYSERLMRARGWAICLTVRVPSRTSAMATASPTTRTGATRRSGFACA